MDFPLDSGTLIHNKSVSVSFPSSPRDEHGQAGFYIRSRGVAVISYASLLREYFPDISPNQGLLFAEINGTYPPASNGYWAANEPWMRCGVLQGTACVIYDEGEIGDLVPGSAAYFPPGLISSIVLGKSTGCA